MKITLELETPLSSADKKILLSLCSDVEAPTKISDLVPKQVTQADIKKQNESKAEVKETPATNGEQKITEVEVRKLATEKSQAGFRPQVKDLITKMGVEKLPDLKPEQYEEFIQKLSLIK